MTDTERVAVDLTTMSDDEVRALEQAARDEMERRALPAQIEAAVERYQALAGVSEGAEYRPPTGAHDVIPPGQARVYEGVLYRNTSGRPLAHSPAEYPAGWTLEAKDAEPATADPAAHPAWSPTASYDADDVVSFDGTVYRCVQAHTAQNGWTPAAVPALWAQA